MVFRNIKPYMSTQRTIPRGDAGRSKRFGPRAPSDLSVLDLKLLSLQRRFQSIFVRTSTWRKRTEPPLREAATRRPELAHPCSQLRQAPGCILVSIFILAILILSPGARLLGDSQSAAADAQSVISFLNQSIEWYRHLPVEQQLASEPGDVTFVNGDRELADQVIRLSFEFALAEADLQSRQRNQSSDQTDSSRQSRYRSLLELAAKADQKVKQSQDELRSLRQKLEIANSRDRKAIQSAIAETQSELELAETRRDVLRSMVEFIGGINANAPAGGSLRSQIEALQRAVPAAATSTKPTAPGQSARPEGSSSSLPAVVLSRKAEPSGILALITDLISLGRKMYALDGTIQLTDALAQSSRNFRTPVGHDLRQLAKRGDELAGQPESTDPTVLAQQRKDLDALTLEFKQRAAVVLPLGKQGILLDLYKRNLTNWRGAVKNEWNTELRSLLMRMGVLAIILAVVFGFSAFWRKAIFRYVPDVRRRYQFLLLRRIVMWFVATIIIAFAFATELGSLATFAGLLTAGVAVALQNVILSVAGYFFLIGKYGVRVGDRVQVSGVTGEVVDIGLVRLHLMELSGGGTDAQPTGRVVAFSNSVVFQPRGGLFKQIPGTNFVWHQITLALGPESNYGAVEERLMGAVESVFAQYRDNMELQRRHVERSLSVMSVNSFGPQSRLRLTPSGLEVVIRYPLELEKAAEIDDRITRALLDAIEHEPKLKLVGTGTPSLQPVSAPAETVER